MRLINSERPSGGSQATWGGWEPRVCYVCGKPTTLKQSTGHSHGPPARSWHTDCATRHRLDGRRRVVDPERSGL